MPPATSATHLKLSTLVYRRELVVYLFMAIIKFPSTPPGVFAELEVDSS